MPEAATPLQPKRTRDPHKEPMCGRCWPLCDKASHNYRWPLQFLTIAEAISQQMGSPEGVLTLQEIAEFYKMSLHQLTRWSMATFTPDDLLGTSMCSCPGAARHVWLLVHRGRVLLEKHVLAKHVHCSRSDPCHKHQRLLTQVAVC